SIAQWADSTLFWAAVAYSVPAIIVPLLMVLFKLKGSHTPAQFHELSLLTKLVMLTGIISMVFFYFYL
ncbi:MAG: hypothetical protein ACO25B_13810, partial [Chitinophagaceae bacterium]